MDGCRDEYESEIANPQLWTDTVLKGLPHNAIWYRIVKPGMSDDGRLRQSSGSRSVDVQQLIVMIGFHNVCRWLFLGSVLQQRGQILRISDDGLLNRIVELVQCQRGWQRFGDLRYCVTQRFSEDQRTALGHGDTVQEGILPQVVVDQRNDDTKLGKTQPSRHELWTVFQQQAYHISTLVAVGVEHVRHSIRVVTDL